MIWVLKLFFIWLLIETIKKSPKLSTAVVIACFFVYSNENTENINNSHTVETVKKQENLYLKKSEIDLYKKDDYNEILRLEAKESALSKKKKQQNKSSYRIGAICRDGSRSNATGSGACSHHGGVDYWLYE